MVDALKDVWRVLVDDGTLVDLRPISADYELELVTLEARIPIGHTDTSPRSEDDAAADAAAAWAVKEGLFVLRRRTELDVDIFWDSVPDLEDYMATRTSTRVTPSYLEIERAYQTLVAESTIRPRLRTSRRLLLVAFDRGRRR